MGTIPTAAESRQLPSWLRDVSTIPNFKESDYLEPVHVFSDRNMQIGDCIQKIVCLYIHKKTRTLVYWQTTDHETTREIAEREARLEARRAAKLINPPAFSRKTITSKAHKKLLAELGVRYKWTCAYCNGPGDPSEGPDCRAWQIDHIYPVSRGGDNKPDNLALACATCNLQKGAGLLSEMAAR